MLWQMHYSILYFSAHPEVKHFQLTLHNIDQLGDGAEFLTPNNAVVSFYMHNSIMYMYMSIYMYMYMYMSMYM